MTEIVFVASFAAYVVYSLVVNRAEADETDPGKKPLGVLFQTPLFFIGAYLAYHFGALGRGLVSPPHFLGGIVLGHVFFTVSVIATNGSISAALAHGADVRGLWRFLVEAPGIMGRFLLVSFSEEFIYRAALQPLLIAWTGSVWIGIAIVAAGFSVTHWHFFRNPPAQSVEFVVFSVALGVMYWLTANLLLVTMVHTVRNLEIVYLEYRARVDELGDETAALNAIEADYAGRGSAEAI